MSVVRSVATAVASVALLAGTLVAAGGVQLAAPEAGSVTFTAAGDYGSSSDALAVFSGIASSGSDLHLALGDMSYGTTGEEQAWCDLVTSRVGAGFPFELLAGNHESNGQNGNINDFAACLPNQLPGAVGTYGRQYYVDVPQGAPLVRYIMISPGTTFPDGHWSYDEGTARYAWTEAAIDGARTAGIPWVVVGMHKPCVTIGNYVCEPGAEITNLLISKRVDLVLNGHEHLYQRTHQLTTRTGCAALVPGAVDSDCIADSDTSMQKGAGTVFATVGTGGRPLRAPNPTDSEVGYFGAWSGSGANPTFGFFEATATQTELTAGFTRTTGGNFADPFTIAVGETPTNTPPVARFTVNCELLACQFDASTSTDAEGPISAYSWNFGDGSSGAGALVEHSYSTAGDHTVTLTVTDGASATGVATDTASTTTEGTPQLASDLFERQVTGSWGSAEVGGAWTVAPASAFSVDSGSGRMSVPRGGTHTANLGDVASAATLLTTSLSLDRAATGSGLYLSVFPRRVPGAGSYGVEARIRSDGTITLQPTRVNASGGGTVRLQSTTNISGVDLEPGDRLNLAIEVSGTSPTTVRAKAWQADAAEPAAWQVTVTDSTPALQAAGGIGLLGYLSGSATNAPITVSFDALAATAP
jgi:PKD repeat protein